MCEDPRAWLLGEDEDPRIDCGDPDALCNLLEEIASMAARHDAHEKPEAWLHALTVEIPTRIADALDITLCDECGYPVRAPVDVKIRAEQGLRPFGPSCQCATAWRPGDPDDDIPF